MAKSKLSDISDLLANSKTINNIIKLLAEKESVSIKQLSGSLKSLLAISVFNAYKNPMLIIVPSKDVAEEYESDLKLFSNDLKITFFDVPEKHAIDNYFNSNDNLYVLDALSKIESDENSIVIITPKVIDMNFPAKNKITYSKKLISVGDLIDFEEFRRELIFKGFEKCDYVSKQGEIAVRGGIIDVFPVGKDNPIRIECWGDEIESIREFDLLSQRSIHHYNDIEIVTDLLAKADETNQTKIFDYIDNSTLFIIDTPDLINNEIDIDELPLEYKKLYVNALGDSDINIKSELQPMFNGSITQLGKEIRRLAMLDYKIYLSADGHIHTQRFKDLLENAFTIKEEELSETSELLADAQTAYNAVHWINATPFNGFVSTDLRIALFTEHQVFNRLKIKNITKTQAKQSGISLKELKQLRVGDYVVHSDKGIAQFEGFENTMIGGSYQDCVKLRYSEGDFLYVNLNYIHKIQKYSAQEGSIPKLSKLGSGEWERKKAKTKRRLKDIARDLIKLYAKRKSLEGYSYPGDTIWQKEFEASFLFEDTPDQRRSTDEVKKDMESGSPMDRLVCGDVGFGKTEIAIRAAFKAAQAGKQTSVLVPTTILAQQHFESFKDRMGKYPVKVDVISRFRSKKEQTDILQNLKEGKIDILIGTHRLLSKDINFKNLGLLIIDEEHRFGVSAKEKLRELRANIDTLTLTATPIPRTLNFSLMGARDLSLIETPPRNRLPVKTQIIEWNEKIIYEAINKEINRRGQVFFVTDKVKDIEKIADNLRKILPDIRISVAHGQMPAQVLEKEMQKFIEKKVDVLLATKIVESGLDIPNANTIIINRAQNFGLAELYQLRGRVGRSNIQAYCYLCVPSFKILNNNILRRLQAIEEFTDLGSGFKLAMRDMEIRGAGNLLGAEQSGFIGDIGFELFHKILDEAVQELRYEEFGDIFDDKYKKKPVELNNDDIAIEMNTDALIPSDYISTDTERFHYYKQLYNLKTNEEIKQIVEEIEDRYGKMPKQAKELIFAVKVRIAALNTGFRKIIIKKGYFVAEFPESSAREYYEIAFPEISEYLQEFDDVKLYQEKEKLYFRKEVEHRQEIIEVLWRIKKTVEMSLG